ncbi:MAG: hypothetical protein IPK19_21860 [Chloroflexi bacterium]|nr:hypothetical protein [Chloroflexota bacterium]
MQRSGNPWNEALEGARILGNFRHLLDPETLMAGDVFLMGTSRTTSAFAPPVLEATLAQAFPEEGSWNVVNLQTYGRYAQRAEDVLERISPDARLIVFEFSPFLFTYESEALVEPSDFTRYRRAIEVEELRLQGALDSMLGMENRVFLDPAYLYSYVLPQLRNLESCQGLYYVLRLKGPGESAAQAMRNEIPVYLSILP